MILIHLLDYGFLGSGIYFAQDPMNSCFYTSTGYKGTRFMFICNVALGSCKKYYKQNPKLENAPLSYHSVQGVKGENCDFKYDEFVIYNENQQQMKYLIEFSLDRDKKQNFEFEKKDFNVNTKKNEIQSEKIRDLLEIPSNTQKNENKEKCGLLSNKGESIPLKKVYVKSKLLDMVGEVMIFQHYKNESKVFIFIFSFFKFYNIISLIFKR